MDISRRQAYVYVGLALVVAVLGARYLFSSHAAAPAGGQPLLGLASYAPSPSSSATPSSLASPQEIVVYVCGAVRRPGRLPSGAAARVSPTCWPRPAAPAAKAELQAVNLAAKLVDGQQVVVPVRGAAGSTVAAAGSAAPGATGTAGAAGAPGTGAPAAAGRSQHRHGRAARRAARRRAGHRPEDHRLPHRQRRLQERRRPQERVGHRRRQVRHPAAARHGLGAGRPCGRRPPPTCCSRPTSAVCWARSPGVRRVRVRWCWSAGPRRGRPSACCAGRLGPRRPMQLRRPLGLRRRHARRSICRRQRLRRPHVRRPSKPARSWAAAPTGTGGRSHRSGAARRGGRALRRLARGSRRSRRAA